MAAAKDWIKSFRLRTLPLALSCVFFSGSVAVFYDEFDGLIFSLIVLTTILLQILSNLANDLGDGMKGTDNANRLGPERAVQSGKISVSEMKRGVIICAILSFIAGCSLIYVALKGATSQEVIFFISLGLASIVAAILYTVGKKAYGYNGLGDLFVFLFFGLTGVGAGYYLYAQSWDNDILWLCLTCGAWSTAVLNLNNMRDIENDAASNKKTLVVKMGIENAKIYHSVLLLLGVGGIIMSAYTLYNKSYLFLAGLLVLPMLIIHLLKVLKNNNPKELDSELKKVALSTFLCSIILFAASWWG